MGPANERRPAGNGTATESSAAGEHSAAKLPHPADNAPEPYQLLPPLTGDEFAALSAEIAAHGVRVPIDVDEDGRILDGHHRAAICAQLGIDCPTRVVAGLSEDEKRSHALAVNVQRRALTREQRRALIAAEIGRDSSRSDREIGRLLGCDHKTVGAVRRELRGEIPHHRLTRVLEEQDYAPFTTHPVLDLFPLVPIELFTRIAVSIFQRGQLLPIVLSSDRTVILDGRIRYLACRAANVEPKYEALGPEWTKEKIDAYVFASNFYRQSFTREQLAEMDRWAHELDATAEGAMPGLPPNGGGS